MKAVIMVFLIFAISLSAAHDKFIFSGIGQQKLEWDLFTMNEEGEDVQRLTATDDINEMSAAFSPDGQTIYYGAQKDGKAYIAASDADGSNVREITNIPSRETQKISISPDGSMLAIGAFEQSQWGSYTYVLYTYTFAGVTLNRVAQFGYRDHIGNFSPDGSKVIVAVNLGDKGLFAVDVSTGEMDKIISGEYSFPRYAVDNDKIIAGSTNTAGWKYYMNLIDPQSGDVDTFYETIYPVSPQLLIGETVYFLKLVETDDSSFFRIFKINTDGSDASYLRGVISEPDEEFSFFMYLNCN